MPDDDYRSLAETHYIIPATAALAADIAASSPLVHRIVKEELRVLANAHPLTPEAHERIQALRREVYDILWLVGSGFFYDDPETR